MTLVFNAIDLASDFDLCLRFRRDAYGCSFDSLDGFDDFIAGYLGRVAERIHQAQWFYFHVWLNVRDRIPSTH